MNYSVKPFVKWAGGKGQILPELKRKYPEGFGESITKYCEPFVGGGAVLFDLLSNYKIEEIIINDINLQLINTYKQIKSHVNRLIAKLYELQDQYWNASLEEKKEIYYNARDDYNYWVSHNIKERKIDLAAYFIFLNRTCYNGLFRVSSRGKFNVPIGSHQNPLICNEENLLAISKALKGSRILSGNYKKCLKYIDENTFVYMDPPYRVLTKDSFNAYSHEPFGDDEQAELKQFADNINELGAKFLISNSDPKNSDDTDHFFDELYKGYDIERIEAKRLINCISGKRGNISELLISN